jgi:DNA-binding MarR family transcriptional regulator
LTAELYGEIVDMSTVHGENEFVDIPLEAERFGAWINLLQAHAVLADALEQRLQSECGLSLAEHETLSRLAGTLDGRLRMADVASLLLVSKSGVTRIVDRLEGAGLVTRGTCHTDRRGTFAVITKEGRDALTRAKPAVGAALDSAFSQHLSDADVRALRRVLRKVLEGNGKWEESRCSPSFRPDPSPSLTP